MLLLSVVSPKSMTIDRITAYDFMTIYGKDFDVSEKNLHGDNSLVTTQELCNSMLFIMLSITRRR